MEIKELAQDEGSIDRTGKRTYTRRFQVKTPHPGLPVQSSAKFLQTFLLRRPDLQPFRSHPGDIRAFVGMPTATRESRYMWEVTVPYTTDIDLREKEEIDNPLTEPAEIDVDTIETEIVVVQDIYGKPIVNTAGVPFLDTIVEVSRAELTIQKNMPEVPDWIYDYVGAINDAPIKIKGKTWPKETLRLKKIRDAKQQQKNGIDFVPLTLTMEFLRENWRKRRYNLGRVERLHVSPRVDDTILVPILAKDGQPIDDPVFLDEFGRAYRVDVDNESERLYESDIRGKAIRTDLKDEEIIILEHEVRRKLDFKKLPHK